MLTTQEKSTYIHFTDDIYISEVIIMTSDTIASLSLSKSS